MRKKKRFEDERSKGYEKRVQNSEYKLQSVSRLTTKRLERLERSRKRKVSSEQRENIKKWIFQKDVLKFQSFFANRFRL